MFTQKKWVSSLEKKNIHNSCKSKTLYSALECYKRLLCDFKLQLNCSLETDSATPAACEYKTAAPVHVWCPTTTGWAL